MSREEFCTKDWQSNGENKNRPKVQLNKLESQVKDEYHGYEQYRDWAEKQKSIRVVSVFVDGGTEEDLVRRLTARGDSPEAIKERVAKYKQEQADYQHRVFDRVFVNTMPKDELEEAVVYFFK